MKSQQFLRIASISLITLAIFSLAGGHWALLQGIAWARMIHDYSSQSSLSTAVEKTFSGHYRCALCKKIAEGKQKEKRAVATENSFQKIKVSRWSSMGALLFPVMSCRNYPRLIFTRYSEFIKEPLTQPPQLLVG